MSALPDVPKLTDPGLYELLQALRRQVQQNTLAIEQATGGSGGDVVIGDQTSVAVMPPQFDNDLTIAPTGWVNLVGKQFSGYYVFSASTVLTPAVAGGLVQYAGAGGADITLTLPPASAMKQGATIMIWAGGGHGLLQSQGGDQIYPGNSNTTSMPIGQGDYAEFMAFAGNAWIVVGGSLHDWPHPPQFDNTQKVATTHFVKLASGNRSGLHGFSGNTVLTAAHAGGSIICFNALTLTMPKANIGYAVAMRIHNVSLDACILTAAAGDTIYSPLGSAATFSLQAGKSVEIISDGGTQWYVSGVGATSGGQFAEIMSFTNPGVLLPQHAGRYVIAFAACNTITLPVAANTPRASAFWIHNATAGGVGIFRQGSDTLTIGNNNAASFNLPAGKFFNIVRGAPNEWFGTGSGI